MTDELYPGGGSEVEFESPDIPPGVPPRSFRKFNRWMDKQLKRLVMQWADRASPAALRGAWVLGRFKRRP